MAIRDWFVRQHFHQNALIETPNHLLFFLGFLLSPVLLFLYLIFTIIREIVRIYLILTLKKKCHGFVRTGDALWAMEDTGWKNIVPTVSMIKSNKEIDLLDIVKKRLKAEVFDNPSQYRKLTSTWFTCFGYAYLEHDTYKLDDCLSEITSLESNSKYLEEKEFKNFLKTYALKPLPMNNRSLWEVVAFTKPFIRTESNGKTSYTYPLLMKFNHMVGDGASILALASALFGAGSGNFEHLEKIVKQKAKAQNIEYDSFVVKAIKALQNMERLLWIVYIFVGYSIYVLLIRKKDESLLHGAKLSGEKHFAYNVEVQEECVPLVKKIKNSIPNVAFSDIVFTAISASLTNYIKKKNQAVPDTFYTAIPVILPEAEAFKRVPSVLENKMTMAFSDINYQKGSLTHTLRSIRDQFAYLRENRDLLEAYYFLTNVVVSPFPLPLLAALPIHGMTCAISSVPAGDKATIFGDLELEYGIVFTLNRWKTGITFAVITYDNKFLVGLLVDKALVPEEDDAQKIVHDFFVNIGLLAEEIVKQK